MKPMIVVSIAARTSCNANRMVCKARKLGGDLAEIRLDYLNREESLGEISGAEKMPLIATFRMRKQGGRGEEEKHGNVENLVAAAEEGFDYVDVQIGTRNLRDVINKIHRLGAKIIVSHHDFQKTPTNAQLDRMLRLCRASGAEIPKIVTTARRLEDNLRLLAFTRKASKDGKVICFGMGRIGAMTRVLSPIYGAAFTFASLDDRSSVAPGQISVQRLRRIYNEMGYS